MPRLVAIDLPGGPEFVTALLKVWEQGHAVLPLDQRLGDSARSSVIKALAPAAVIDRQGSEPLDGAEPVEPGDALVVATSGTTGAPKGVVLTHEAVRASALATSARLGVDPSRHRWLACLPLNHVGGLSVVTRSLITGTPLKVLPGFDPAAVAAASGPEVLVSLVAATLGRVDPGSFSTIVLGGSAPPEALPPNVVTTYGMTETGSGVVYDGVPLEGVEIRLDPVSSEILLRGPMLLRCYRDGTVPFDAEGWLHTGDIGSFDASDKLVVQGRLSEMIITGGENVWPAQVETVLRTLPEIADVAVAGRQDPTWGQVVVAYVVPKELTTPPKLEALKETVTSAIASFAAPREMVLVRAIPRTSIGKIRRAELA